MRNTFILIYRCYCYIPFSVCYYLLSIVCLWTYFLLLYLFSRLYSVLYLYIFVLVQCHLVTILYILYWIVICLYCTLHRSAVFMFLCSPLSWYVFSIGSSCRGYLPPTCWFMVIAVFSWCLAISAFILSIIYLIDFNVTKHIASWCVWNVPGCVILMYPVSQFLFHIQCVECPWLCHTSTGVTLLRHYCS